jgi:hypothetical protein
MTMEGRKAIARAQRKRWRVLKQQKHVEKAMAQGGSKSKGTREPVYRVVFLLKDGKELERVERKVRNLNYDIMRMLFVDYIGTEIVEMRLERR